MLSEYTYSVGIIADIIILWHTVQVFQLPGSNGLNIQIVAIVSEFSQYFHFTSSATDADWISIMLAEEHSVVVVK